MMLVNLGILFYAASKGEIGKYIFAYLEIGGRRGWWGCEGGYRQHCTALLLIPSFESMVWFFFSASSSILLPYIKHHHLHHIYREAFLIAFASISSKTIYTASYSSTAYLQIFHIYHQGRRNSTCIYPLYDFILHKTYLQVNNISTII